MSNYHKPSEEQRKIIEQHGNVVVTAKPGSGKTFTIVEKINMISKDLLDYQGIIAISFTRKASQELEARCKRKGVEKKASFYGTIDKFYLSEIIFPFAKLLDKSISDLEIRPSLDDYSEYKTLKNITSDLDDDELNTLLITGLIEGHVFLEKCGETALLIIKKVRECLNYLTARYTHVFIDEYQDCGEVQHQIFLKLVENGVTGIAVGDLDQAIYAFSGRYSKYLFALISHNQFTYLKINKNHRCHKSISDYSLSVMGVPNIFLTEESRVFKVNVKGNDKEVINSIDQNISRLKEKYGLSHNNDFAILCRGNASAKRASEFLNAKNKLFVDTKLDNSNTEWGMLFNDLLSSYYSFKASQTTKLDFVELYFSEEYDKKNFDDGLLIIHKLFSLQDHLLYENFDLFKDFAKLVYPNSIDKDACCITKDVLKNEKERLNFKPGTKDQISIMTLHKSKGLEFKCVFLLDTYRWILPPEYQATEEDFTQALNLHYVGITRAIEACYIMIGTERYRAYKDDFINAQESPFLYRYNTPHLRINKNW